MNQQPIQQTARNAPQPRQQRRYRPKQQRNAPPVRTEEVPIAAEPVAKQKNPQSRKPSGLAASLGTPTPRGNPDAFKPQALNPTGSQERNDPLLLDAILVDGVNGAVACARERKFKLDYSQYIQIIRASYHVMTRLDRGLQKFMSFSVYQYYCVILLWKRLRYILTERGENVNEYESFRRKLPPMAIPDEIGYYLDGIGNITDYNARAYYLELQDHLRQTLINGVSGTFGRVDPVSHLSYETVPSPFVAVYRILQDMAKTSASRPPQPIDYNVNWDLPVDLKPEGNYQPNRNLLCWDRCSQLTTEQFSMCDDAGLSVTFEEGNPVFDTTGVANFDGIPIIYQMLLQTSELLSGSKSQYNNHAEATSYKGSLAQVGFIKRGDVPDHEGHGFTLPPLSEREGTGMFYTQVSVHMWKLGRVVPIKKTGNSVEMDNLRPISILPTLSKVVEVLLKNQLIVHIDAHSLLSDSQYGFRCGRNTTSLLLGLTDKIRQSVSNGGVSLLLSLDLKKAFDKVDHGILIEKLYRNFNISITACKLIASFLADRSQYVSVGSRISSILPVRSGVPQGSVLGPLLFDMYINDIFGCINFTSCVSFAYADDLLFLLSGERQFADVLQQMINYCVSNISDWMWNNKLFVNVQKTKVMFFGSGVMDFIVDIDGMQVEFVDKIYCLGIWLDNKLTFERHINYIISKVNYSLRRLYSVNLILPMHIKLMVVHSLIMPIFLYGIEVYSGTIGIYMRKLRILFNRVVRYLYCLRIRNSVSSYVSDFLGCSFYSFVKLRTFLFFYKAWKGGHLLFLMSFFKFGRSRRNCQILIPKLTSILERSFHVRVAHMFNALPNCLKTFEFSYCVYEKRILKHIQENGI